MPSRPLTKKRCDAAQPTGKGWSTTWDTDVRGLGLRVRSSGRKTFVVFYRTQAGEKRLHTLGRYGSDLTLEQARRKARSVLGQVVDGNDPADARRRARLGCTVSELCTAYLERHARPHKRSVEDDEFRIKKIVRPAWGTRKAESINRADAAVLHRKVGGERGRYVANRVLALVSHVWTWGEREGFLPEQHPNPARGVKRFAEQSRDRWLTPEEVRRVLQALEKERSVYVRGYLWLLFLTGCRKVELLAARWSDVDLERGILRLPTTKAGRVHYVPLSELARQVFEGLPHEVGSPFVFPGLHVDARMSTWTVDNAWRRIRSVAEVEDARIHDVRRTVGSWLAQSGVSIQIVGRVLNHTSAAATQVYARLADESARQALESHGRALLEKTGLIPNLSLS